MRKFNLLLSFLFLLGITLVSCEGPMGPAGENGADGVDANESCKECHNPEVVDLISTQFQFSKHEYGEAAFEEAGNTGCTPCHAQEAFKYVVANNTPATYTIPAGGTNNSNNYVCSSSTAYGELGCSTCHSSLHKTGTMADISPLTTVAAVPMLMWNSTKTIDLTQGGGGSNLCAKCHQPRPVTKNNGASPTGAPIDYAALTVKANYNNAFWTGTSNTAGTGDVKPSYRTHVHYGAAGAVYAGKGGVEFAEDETYSNSWHTTGATCQDCHMAPMTGRAGGHTFFAKGNFNGCNVTGCHTSSPVTATNTAYWVTPRNNIKALLDQLGGLLTVTHNNGTTYEILNRNSDAEANLWAGLTTNKYDGYWNIINSSNPNTGATVIPNTYFTVTNVQMGAVINFQLALRDFSLGIHNYKYTHALLHNTIKALGATPVN